MKEYRVVTKENLASGWFGDPTLSLEHSINVLAKQGYRLVAVDAQHYIFERNNRHGLANSGA